MNQKTINQLNALNRQFYQTVAQDFDQTRQQHWAGWETCRDTIAAELPIQYSTLDVGCGNGRFGNFLAQQSSPQCISYTGVDSNRFLLESAQTAQHIPNTQLIHQDILTQPDTNNVQSYDLVVMFGVLHHIPSFELRQQVLLRYSKVVKTGGFFIISAWQFDTIPSLLNRASQPPVEIGIDASELETGDYFLDWKRGSPATRYCHLTSDQELTKLTQPLHFTEVARFVSDGKNTVSNLYWIGRHDAAK